MSYHPWQPLSAPVVQENYAAAQPYENQWEQPQNFEEIKTEENPIFPNNESVIIENSSVPQDRIPSITLNLPGNFLIKPCIKIKLNNNFYFKKYIFVFYLSSSSSSLRLF